MLQIVIKQPGTGRTAALTKAQFDACHDMIVAYMNAAMAGRGKKQKLDDAMVIAKCAEAGVPIEF